MNRFLRGIGLYLLIAIIAVSIVSNMFPPAEQREQLNLTQLMSYMDQGQIRSATIIGDETVEGTLTDGTRFTTSIPSAMSADVAEKMLASGVELEHAPEPPPPFWVSFLPNLITIVIFVGLWLFIMNQMQGGSNRAMSFAKSKAKLHSEERTKVAFDDVAGLDEAKQELQEIVEFLKHPKRFVEVGAKIPKGVLLAGPPGTGKTLMARAVAGEAGCPFFSISGSDFVEMFVGVGASRVRDMFETAKKNSPCIVFIDELDAVGRHRGAGLGGGHDEREQTLNQLLVEMDGFEPNSGIIIMAATNRPDVLDPALLRPGRFDRKVIVDRPDVVGREEILAIHSRKKPLAEDVDLEILARRTPGFVGADLENLMNEAAILAARRGKKKITMSECEEAIDRVMMGPERRRKVLREQDKKVLAFHEAGHAVVAHFLPNSDPVHKVTIIGRGMAGGYTMVLPAEDRLVETRSELLDMLAHLLGGRTAEELAFNEVSTGAQNDLDRATKLARKMVTEWGMSERLGPLTYGRQQEEQIFLGRDISRDRNYSEEVAADIDEEVRKLIDEAHKRARQMLTEHKAELENVVAGLNEYETLDRDEFVKAIEGRLEPRKEESADAGEDGEAVVGHEAVADSAAEGAEDEASSDGEKRSQVRTTSGKQQPKPAVSLD